MVIEMERKIFGQRSKLGSTKEYVLKMFRLIHGSGKDDLNASSCTDENEDLGYSNIYSPQSYLVAKQRMYEIEVQKAMAILESRHQRWKAGGPV